MDHNEETEILRRAAINLFGPNVILTPSMIEEARQIWHRMIVERALTAEIGEVA